MKSIKEEIEQLKKEKNAVILAHYYVPDEVQEIADYIGDSYYLSKKAKETEAEIIVFAGVSFMGESAKILNPSKTVLMPDGDADCPMAHMASVEKVQKMRAIYQDLAVVCYINSTAELKTVSDVCVTSSNAVKIVKALPNRNIFFIPDGNLAAYVAEQVPEKNIIPNDGYCPVHRKSHRSFGTGKEKNIPRLRFLYIRNVCRRCCSRRIFIGSTSEIISHAEQSFQKEFIIGTEEGVLYELKKKCPDKSFHCVMEGQCCSDMKKVTLEKVRDSLKNGTYEIQVPEVVSQKALKALDTMLELAK